MAKFQLISFCPDGNIHVESHEFRPGQTVPRMLGYLTKDQFESHFRSFAKNYTQADIAAGVLAHNAVKTSFWDGKAEIHKTALYTDCHRFHQNEYGALVDEGDIVDTLVRMIRTGCVGCCAAHARELARAV